MTYGTSSHAYLARAKACLETTDRPFMFYAALELRCCIEARQDEYLEAQERYRRSQATLWQAGKKAKELDRIFAQEKISKITLIPSSAPPLTVYHLPVNKSLVNNIDRLGNYMHASKFRAPSDPWWTDFRTLLLDTYRGAWTVCRGSLLCPPFLHKDGSSFLAIEAGPSIDPQIDLRAYGKPGDLITTKVEYPDKPPGEWQCDL